MSFNTPKVSLILCTLERTEEVEYFLNHASKFTFQNFEIIIADQNEDNRINQILNKYKSVPFSIKHLRTQKGLSRSRNQAILYASGEILAFPDDDCTYERNTIERVQAFFELHPEYSILIAQWKNPKNDEYQPHANFISHPITNFKEIFSLMSSEIFIRKNVIDQIGYFDEKLGLGSNTIFKGGEDYDFLLRALNNQLKIYYSKDIIIYHPWKGIDKNSSKQRIKQYLHDITYAGASDFYLLKKNVSTITLLKIIINNLLATFYFLLKLDKIQFRNHLHRIKGFWIGFKEIHNDKRSS